MLDEPFGLESGTEIDFSIMQSSRAGLHRDMRFRIVSVAKSTLKVWLQSCLSASMGWTEAARRAGIQLERIETAIKSAEVPTSVNTSSDPMP